MAPEVNTLSFSLLPINCDDPMRRSLLSDDAVPIKCSVKSTLSISGGETQGFEELFKLHHRRVYSICLRMTRNQADAEDLTQEVFVQVFCKLASFRGESAFTTWLYRLTVNHVFTHFPKSRVRKKKSQTMVNSQLRCRRLEANSAVSPCLTDCLWMRR